MPIAAPLIIGAATLGSAAIGASAASKASSAQAAAASSALDFQKSVLDQNQERYAATHQENQDIYNANKDQFQPYLNTGRGATYSLASLYGINPETGGRTNGNVDYSQFYNSPDYAFAQQQGQLGLDRYQAAKGMALSGGALKDVAQFNQGLASQQYGNYFNRLLGLSQIGQNAAGQAAGFANNYMNTNANLSTNTSNNASGMANTIGNTQQGVGQAQAAGYVGSANAITGSLNSGIQNSLLYNAMNRSSYASPTASAMFGGNAGNPFGTGSFGAIF